MRILKDLDDLIAGCEYQSIPRSELRILLGKIELIEFAEVLVNNARQKEIDFMTFSDRRREILNNPQNYVYKGIRIVPVDILGQMTIERIETQAKSVLKIKFINLESGLLMTVLEQNNEALGIKCKTSGGLYIDYTFTASNGVKVMFHETAILDEGEIYLPESLTRLRNISDFDPDVNFEEIKFALSQFAAYNAFHDNEKTVPRIEFYATQDNCDIYQFFSTKDANARFLNRNELNQLAELFGCQWGEQYPIYEPKPKFSSSWKKVSPREYKREDLPNTFSLETTDEKPFERIAPQIIEKINKLNAQSEFPETWIFEMKINNVQSQK